MKAYISYNIMFKVLTFLKQKTLSLELTDL